MKITDLRHRSTNHIIECYILPAHQESSNITTVDYNSKNCKTQTLSEEECWGKPKVKRRQNKDTRGISRRWHLQLQETLNTVQFLASLSQIFTLKDVISYSLYKHIWLSTKNLHGMTKCKEKAQSEETAITKIKLSYDADVGIIKKII